MLVVDLVRGTAPAREPVAEEQWSTLVPDQHDRRSEPRSDGWAGGRRVTDVSVRGPGPDVPRPASTVREAIS
jgi:hypothetical protein